MGRASKREMKARNKLQAAGSRDDVPQRGEGTGQGLVVRNIESEKGKRDHYRPVRPRLA